MFVKDIFSLISYINNRHKKVPWEILLNSQNSWEVSLLLTLSNKEGRILATTDVGVSSSGKEIFVLHSQ